MSDNSISIKVVKSISEWDREEWNSCAIFYSAEGLEKIEDSFISYDFLDGLEKSKSVGENTGWLPYHLAAIRRNKLIGAVPLYLNTNTQG